MKNIKKTHPRQEKNKKIAIGVNHTIRVKPENKIDQNKWADSETGLTHHDFRLNPEEFLLQLQKQGNVIFNVFRFLIKLQNLKLNYVSQAFIAMEVGATREHTNRCIRWLRDRGLIDTYFRPNKTCFYRLNDYFHFQENRDKLKHIIKELQWAPLFLFYLIFVNIPAHSISRNNNYPITLEQKNEVYREQWVHKNHQRGRVVDKNYFYVKRLKYFLPKKESMKPIDSPLPVPTQFNPICAAIRNITELHLTKWGQIALSCFPPSAITYARSIFSAMYKGNTDRFQLFYDLCMKYCVQQHISPNYNKVNYLTSTYKMPEDAKMLLPKATEQRDPTKEENNVAAAKIDDHYQNTPEGRKFGELFGYINPWKK